MIRTSVRLRLTLWNIGALTLALLVFASVVHGTVQAMLLSSVDRDLASEAGSARQHFLFRTRILQKGEPRQSSDRIVKYGVNGLQVASITNMSKLNASKTDPEIARIPEMAQALSGEWNAMLLPSASARHKQIIVHLENWGDRAPSSAGTKRWPVSDGYTTLTDGGQPLRVFSKPMRNASGKTTGFVQAAYSLTEMHNLVRGLDRTLLILIPPALLVAGLGGAFLTGRTLRPITQISQAAAALEASDLSRRLPAAGNDEFARLAATFNSLFGRLETAFVRLEDAVAQQKRFTADASHELRTPLTTIKSYADWARRHPRQPEEYLEALTAVETAADRMARIVEDLLQMAQGDHGIAVCSLAWISVPELLTRVREALPTCAVGPCLSFTAKPLDLRCQGDLHLLERLLTNLIDNSVRHTPPSGTVLIHAEQRADGVVITVEDNGEGIPAEHLPHVRERFYRVDSSRTRARGGAGLGLAICQGIAEAHGGLLTVESAVGQGTRVTVALPIASSQSSK